MEGGDVELIFHAAIGVFGLWASQIKPRQKALDAVCLVVGGFNIGIAIGHAVALVLR